MPCGLIDLKMVTHLLTVTRVLAVLLANQDLRLKMILRLKLGNENDLYS